METIVWMHYTLFTEPLIDWQFCCFWPYAITNNVAMSILIPVPLHTCFSLGQVLGSQTIDSKDIFASFQDTTRPSHAQVSNEHTVRAKKEAVQHCGWSTNSESVNLSSATHGLCDLG